MAIATRSRTSSPTKKIVPTPSTAPVQQTREPLKHFILPRDLSDDARLIMLNHPQSSTPQRFLLCPDRGLFQFTKVNSPATEPRSLLFSSAENNTTEKPKLSTGANTRHDIVSTGYISKNADFFVATPFDAAFLLVALILPAALKSSKSFFQPFDDIFEHHIQEDNHLRYLFVHGRPILEAAMARFCDTTEAGDEQMYRPSEDKTLRMIMQKVDSVIAAGLPASLEEKFVKRKLELPVLSIRREDSNTSAKSSLTAQDTVSLASESFDSQSSGTSSAPSLVFSEVSTATSTSTIAPDTVPEKVHDLQKQCIVLDFILASYVPTVVAERLKSRFSATNTPIDFTPLEEHLKTIATMRAEVAASRSIGDYSRKRGLEDDEATELREEKKRKQEEEDKRKKAGESRGVKNLKKVNVSGMKKMSDFFTKKAAAKVK